LASGWAEFLPVNLDTLSREVLNLPMAQRAALARALIHSFDDDADADPAAIEAAWAEEIARRVAEVHAGRVTGRPAELVFNESRAEDG
jgi:putative addiction module component (TIGR02574 family)